ncbi:unnamed protein product [Ranitomeya imitator]|uniref:C2 domain-containing protein n=1 Tax=Ranitomeya imitator TaxID=111125 RepID=A0ABN9LGE2_9NEOB|nr:unnamed protein product [Ranitomeya imitator]
MPKRLFAHHLNVIASITYLGELGRPIKVGEEISKSQNDMTDKCYLSTDYGKSAERRKERRSHSDTAIHIASELEKSKSLHELIHKVRKEVQEIKNYPSQKSKETDDPNKTMFFGSLKRASMTSINSVGTDVGSVDNGSVTGEIELAISYNLKTCTLEISIKACKNLAHGEEKKKKCNPYVKTYLLPDKSPISKMKTSIKKNTVDPSFNECLKYTIERSQMEKRTLQISVWHAGRLKRKVFLGEVLIPLEFWDFDDNSTKSFTWYQLKAKDQELAVPQRNPCLMSSLFILHEGKQLRIMQDTFGVTKILTILLFFCFSVFHVVVSSVVVSAVVVSAVVVSAVVVIGVVFRVVDVRVFNLEM